MAITRSFVLLGAAALLLGACRGAPGDRVAIEATRSDAPSSETFQGIVSSVLPAIVFIQAEARAPERAVPLPGLGRTPDELLPIGVGSGVIYSPDGYILTNNHVVQQADRVSVLLYDRRQFEAEVVARDPSTDVAVVRIPGGDFPYARLGDSDAVQMGDWVLALGSPLGLQFTVTAGIVSGTGRALGVLRVVAQTGAPQAAPLEHFIQTDAAINVGNSGGPLVDLAGQVIGINTAIASPTGAFAGYGFAIPSNLARHVADQLVRHGEVRRAFLGVVLDNVSAADAEVYRLERAEGAEVKVIEPGSPAERAGLQIGDVILRIDDLLVATVSDLQAALARLTPGRTARLRLVRYGEALELPIELGVIRSGVAPERTARAPEAAGGLGFGVADGGGEVVVTDVHPFSAAARAGLRPGHVVREVNRQPVRSRADVVAAVRAAERPVVSLLVEDSQVGTTIVNFRLPG